jgi:hypothetical protein
MSVIGIDIPWSDMEELLDKTGPKEGRAEYQSDLICSYTVDKDHQLADAGYVFLGILKRDHIINQEIHVWGKR